MFSILEYYSCNLHYGQNETSNHGYQQISIEAEHDKYISHYRGLDDRQMTVIKRTIWERLCLVVGGMWCAYKTDRNIQARAISSKCLNHKRLRKSGRKIRG